MVCVFSPQENGTSSESAADAFDPLQQLDNKVNTADNVSAADVLNSNAGGQEGEADLIGNFDDNTTLLAAKDAANRTAAGTWAINVNKAVKICY